ncbi:MAG: hypothetical protein WC721_11510 [Victivallaceae bacterium]
MKSIVLNDTPKCRSGEARKVESKKSERGGETVVLNDTPKCRNAGCPEWFWCSAVRPGRSCPKWTG